MLYSSLQSANKTLYTIQLLVLQCILTTFPTTSENIDRKTYRILKTYKIKFESYEQLGLIKSS